MPKRSGFKSSIQEFITKSNDEILGELTKFQEGSVEITQRDAWQDQINLLKEILPNFKEGYILFEFKIPRIGKRVDNILIIKNTIFAIEFKVGSENYFNQDKVQAIDYALDLKNFHAGSHDANIVPILVSTEAKDTSNNINFSEDGILNSCLLANKFNLKNLIDDVLSKTNIQKEILFSDWINSSYLPTPTIIEASKVLYKGHGVSDISRNEAGSDNLGQTSILLNEIIDNSKRNNEKSIILLTGIPGAGKTLAGLNLACERRMKDKNEEEHAVFLTGNVPLVSVLSESLAIDASKNNKNKTKAEALREVKSFIQNVHHFRDECLENNSPPTERIVIFDEAQRAYDLDKTKSFMKRNKNKPDFNFSEPEFLIQSMDRHTGWTSIVCLVGGGQEINKGEGGMEEWLKALRDNFPDWKVWISNALDSKYYLPTFNLDQLNGRLFRRDNLHLSISIRSFRSEKVAKYISNLLEGNISETKNLLGELKDLYPIKITRSLTKAKHWLRNHARGSERYGLLTSSGASRLKPLGIFSGSITKDNVASWFLKENNDVRSSLALEDAATEFQVQGLELDWAGLIWDGDLIKTSTDWLYKSFVGTKWNNIMDQEAQKNKLNAYRVLLTRARQGMIIVVPEGDQLDKTRDSEKYDPTWNYLKEIGIDVI